jgi:hypothetical protein
MFARVCEKRLLSLDGPTDGLYYSLAVEDDSRRGAEPLNSVSSLSSFQANHLEFERAAAGDKAVSEIAFRRLNSGVHVTG